MKKLLAILLILGMASMANAAISIGYNSGTGNLEVSSSTTAVWTGYLAVVDDTNGDYGTVVATASAGNTASVGDTYDHSYVTGMYDVLTDINANHADPFTTIASGVQFTAPVTWTGSTAATSLTIDLLDLSLVKQGSITFTPEPMTLSLLGLGGLALLRRRR